MIIFTKSSKIHLKSTFFDKKLIFNPKISKNIQNNFKKYFALIAKDDIITLCV